LQIGKETAAPLADTVLKSIHDRRSTRTRIHTKANIEMTVVQEQLGFTWAWNETAYDNKTGKEDPDARKIADDHLMGACYGAQGYGK
jgi:hypothetical protein